VRHCTSGIFFGLTILVLPPLCGGATNGFENALIELEEQAASNVLAAVTTDDVEPLRAATWAFGQFLTKYGKARRETWDAATLTRLNKLRLMFAQAAFSMRDRRFDAEKEKERVRDSSVSSQDHAKWKAVFNREAQLEMIHKGFVMEARHHGGVTEGVSGDKTQAFKRLVEETVKDEELKGGRRQTTGRRLRHGASKPFRAPSDEGARACGGTVVKIFDASALELMRYYNSTSANMPLAKGPGLTTSVEPQ